MYRRALHTRKVILRSYVTLSIVRQSTLPISQLIVVKYLITEISEKDYLTMPIFFPDMRMCLFSMSVGQIFSSLLKAGGINRGE